VSRNEDFAVWNADFKGGWGDAGCVCAHDMATANVGIDGRRRDDVSWLRSDGRKIG
jgi:hypothetical protein